ncbi:MAG: bifunctional precorrin-2 dehydrogenase/sirohydrochlorin ferrochelatase [Deltaproteobacteria bacterium]|nr:bifunctional precorrin-2 dehydrogenase/sirohydrochlorin ferrochelatase [Deltaproteobacteria bacterium]
MAFYSVCLDISNKRCVVVGGGEVAERKATGLLECGAKVVLVARDLTSALRAMKDAGEIEQISDDYKEEYLEGAFLVIGATDREDVNETVFRDTRDRGILVNIVDVPARCNFIVPSVFRRGDLLVAVSTGGKSPALARRVREEIEERYGPEYGILLTIMGTLRERIIARGAPSAENRILFEAVLDSPVLRYIREGKGDRVREIIRDLTGEDIEVGF